MSRLLKLSVAGLCLACTVAGAADAPAKPAARPAAKAVRKAAPPAPLMEQQALDILKAASDRLAGAKSMSFTAVTTHERPSRLGPPLVLTARHDVLLARPDKLRVITPGDGPASEFYYDGRIMAAYAPAENLVAIAEAPPTIDAALEAAYKGASIYYSFTDLIVADPFKDLKEGLKQAYYVGQSKVVAGTTTDIVAYIQGDVFVQIWIGAEDKLPRLMRAIYLNDPLKQRYAVVLSDWKLDVDVPAGAFATEKTASATHIPFKSPYEPPTVKAPAKGKSPPKSATPAVK